MTAPKPANEWQDSLPNTIPLYVRRNLQPGEAGCWLWTRTLSRDGYALISHGNKTHQGHRLIYQMLIGSIPPGLVLDHLCTVRNCVNPEHLEPVTNAENLRRSPSTTSGMSTCVRGHDLSLLAGQRRCLTCKAEYDKKWRREHAA